MTSQPPTPTPFGAPMKKLFLIDPNYRNLNHGSFGTYPTQILKTQQNYVQSLESWPDISIRYTQQSSIDASRESLSSLLNIPVDETVLVKNATTGVNTVLHNLVLSRTLQKKDVIIYFDTVYGGVHRTLLALRELAGIELRKVVITFPLSSQEIIERIRGAVEEARREGLQVKAAVFETVISNPGIRFPFEDATKLCREMGILSVIDGAHGVGLMRLDLGRLGADFFTSNCHKWLYTPRSCAILHVPTRHQHLIRTSIPTSWGFIPSPQTQRENPLPPSVLPDSGKSAFVKLFEFTGTTDDSAYVCVPAAMEFRNEICGGEERIYAYLEELAGQAGLILAEALGTEMLAPTHWYPRKDKDSEGEKEEKKGLGCGMCNVRLPIRISGSGTGDGRKEGVSRVKREDVSSLTQWIEGQLVEKGTFVPVFPHGEWLWTRVSAQVYLEKSDFEWLGGILKEILGRVDAYLHTLSKPLNSRL